MIVIKIYFISQFRGEAWQALHGGWELCPGIGAGFAD